jgi:hypothetical protein
MAAANEGLRLEPDAKVDLMTAEVELSGSLSENGFVATVEWWMILSEGFDEPALVRWSVSVAVALTESVVLGLIEPALDAGYAAQAVPPLEVLLA